MNVVEQIHQDFDVAAQEFLDKANDILTSKREKSPVHDKLKEFGFKRSSTIVEVEEDEKAKKLAKEVQKKVNYYFEKYPFNKFITKEQVKDICKKYGLVFGKVEWFTGDIPEQNQVEIADFKVADEDKKSDSIMIVATKEEFDTQGLNLSDGWELKELPKDPIVLYPVVGGYLIVSKWGKEADLDEVQ